MQPSRIESFETKSSYEITVQELARQTSPEDTRILLVALNSLGAPIPERIPEPWRGVFQLIHGMPVELQDKKTQLISIARQVLVHRLEASQQAPSLEAPQQTQSEEPVNKAPRLGTQSGTPGGMFGMMSSPLLVGIISEYLSPKSRASLAQTGRMMRDAVRAHAVHQAAVFNNEPGLAALFRFLGWGGPINAENFDVKMNDLLTNYMPAVFRSFRESAFISEDERRSLLEFSSEAVVNDPHLLCCVLRAYVDNEFVTRVMKHSKSLPADILSAIQAASKLEDKTQIIKSRTNFGEELLAWITVLDLEDLISAVARFLNSQGDGPQDGV